MEDEEREVVPFRLRLDKPKNKKQTKKEGNGKAGWEEVGVPTVSRKNEQDRVPPNVVYIEEAVLGALMLEPQNVSLVKTILPGEQYFYSTQNRTVYRAITSLHNSGSPIDQVTIVEWLSNNQLLEKAGGPSIVAALVGDVATAVNVEYHADIVRKWGSKRLGIDYLSQTKERLYEPGVDVEKEINNLVHRLREDVARNTGVTSERMSYSGKGIFQRRVQGMKQRVNVSSLVTGYNELDKYLHAAFFPGGLTVIAARPSVGKSSLKANLTVNFCNAGYGVLSVTPEQGFDREMDRIDSIVTGIPLEELKSVSKWKSKDPRIKKVLKANKIYAELWNFSVMARRDVSWADVETEALDRETQGTKTNVIFVDLLDRLEEIRNARQGDKANVIKQILIRSTELADRTKSHVVMLANLLRGSKLYSTDGRPTMEWIRDSGGWEEVCDTVLLLHPGEEGFLDVIFGKQRDGPAGNHVFARLPFDKTTLTIGDIDSKSKKQRAASAARLRG